MTRNTGKVWEEKSIKSSTNGNWVTDTEDGWCKRNWVSLLVIRYATMFILAGYT